MSLDAAPEETAALPDQAASPWWTFNLRLIVVGVCIWLLLTLLGAQAAGQVRPSIGQFIVSAQVIPLLYLALVVVYGLVMNRRAKKCASEPSEAHTKKQGLMQEDAVRPTDELVFKPVKRL